MDRSYDSKGEEVKELLEMEEEPYPQKDMVEEFGWSDALTSQILGEMEDNDEIFRYRLGRENYVCLPEDKPDFLE